jgi:plastocyanin
MRFAERGLMGRKRCILIAVAMALVGASCTRGGPVERLIRVDYSHDEFASFFMANFPRVTTAAAGDTLVFKQTWTGEPHTVTGGKLVDQVMSKLKYYLPFFEDYNALRAKGVALPDQEKPQPGAKWADAIRAIERSDEEPQRTRFLEAYDGIVGLGIDVPSRDDLGDAGFTDVAETIDLEANKAFESTDGQFPFALGADERGYRMNQNAAQPCYLRDGLPPEEPTQACKSAEQRQPVFDGTASYYSSGVIPYEGTRGNTYRVSLAPDLAPASYFFYCSVHGPNQYTEVKVVPEGEAVAAEDASRRAQEEIDEFSQPMIENFRDARDGVIEIEGETVRAPFAGVSTAAHGSINEFFPKTIDAKVGEPVTWKLMGADHTVTFDVPDYFPIIRFAADGTVQLNEKLAPPAGGSPKIPEDEGDDVISVDAGTYDGTGFFSSGLFTGRPYAEYTLRFSKAGTYKYACLIHPPMVGTVEVTR